MFIDSTEFLQTGTSMSDMFRPQAITINWAILFRVSIPNHIIVIIKERMLSICCFQLFIVSLCWQISGSWNFVINCNFRFQCWLKMNRECKKLFSRECFWTFTLCKLQNRNLISILLLAQFTYADRNKPTVCCGSDIFCFIYKFILRRNLCTSTSQITNQ